MTTLKLIRVLEVLQAEDFQYFIEWLDIGDYYEYQILVTCTKPSFDYISDVLNKEHKLGVSIEFIPDSFKDLYNGKGVITTDIKAYW